MSPRQSADPPKEPRGFNTTRWSIVLASADAQTGDTRAAQALAQLCRTYWRPIFAFVARRVTSQEDAEDLTQDFFLTVMTSNLLRGPTRSAGAFARFCSRR